MKVIYCCSSMKQAYKERDIFLCYDSDEWKIELGDSGHISGTNTYTVCNCPFCGAKLTSEVKK